MNNSQNKKQYNLESIETNTSFDQEHIGNNIVNILRNYSEERKISQIESPNVKKTGPVDKKNIDSTMSFLLTKNNVNQTIEVNASLNNRTSETLNFNLHNNINSSPTTTFPVGNHNNSSDTLSYKIRDNMKRSFSKANDDIDETELDLIETVITRIFNGRNDLVLLVEIFKRDESYKNLEAALNLVTSKNTEDHVKYYNDKHHNVLNRFIIDLIDKYVPLSVQEDKHFVNAMLKFVQNRLNFELKLNVDQFKNMWKTKRSRDKKKAKIQETRIINEPSNPLDRPLEVCLSIKEPKDYQHLIFDMDRNLWPGMKQRQNELYYYLRSRDQLGMEDIIFVEEIKKSFEIILNYYQKNSLIKNSFNDPLENAIIFLFKKISIEMELPSVKKVDISSNGIYTEIEKTQKKYYFKIAGATYSSSYSMKNILLDWYMVNSLCPKMKMNGLDKQLYQFLGCFTYQKDLLFCKHRSLPMPFVEHVRKIFLNIKDFT